VPGDVVNTGTGLERHEDDRFLRCTAVSRERGVPSSPYRELAVKHDLSQRCAAARDIS
jgi:hypothetical protein